MANSICLVCGSKLIDAPRLCPRCETPHHQDCWEYNSGCAVYACNSATRAAALPGKASGTNWWVGLLPFVLLVALMNFVSSPNPKARPSESTTRVRPHRPLQRGDLSRNPQVELHTSRGIIAVELFEDAAPNTVANFISLAESGFYDGTTFHRIIKDFIMQGGDPLTKTGDRSRWGTGGPGYTIADENLEGAYSGCERGTLAMCNAGPNTGGSQFFITFKDHAYLEGRQTVFGQVVRGMDVVDLVDRYESARDDSEIPVSGLKLVKVVVRSKRSHPYVFAKHPAPR